MRQEDLVFTDVAEYTGTNIPVKFDPVIGPDVTPLMEQNRDQRSQNFENHRKAEEKNIELDRLSKDLADDNNVKRIAHLSETLMAGVKWGVDRHIKGERAEGELWAHENKDLLIQAYNDRDAKVKTLQEGQNLADSLASGAEKDGAPVDVIKRFKELGAYRQYTAQRIILQQIGNQYPTWSSSAEANQISVEVPVYDALGKKIPDKSFKGGYRLKKVTSNMTGLSAPEQAALTAAKKKAYLAKYPDIGGLADRNEFVYGAITKWEESLRLQRAQAAKLAYDEDKKENYKNITWTAFNSSDPAQAVKILNETIQQMAVSEYDGNVHEAADALLEGIAKGLKSGYLDPSKVNNAFASATFIDKSVSKTEPIALYNSKAFSKAIARHDIKGAVWEATQANIKKKRDQVKLRGIALENRIRDVIIPGIIAEQGGVGLSERQLAGISLMWMRDPDGGVVGNPIPDSIKDYPTIQDQNDQLARVKAEYWLEQTGGAKGGGYLTSQQLASLPQTIRSDYEQYKADPIDREPPSSYVTGVGSITEWARTLANGSFSEKIGKNDTGSAGWIQYRDNAVRAGIASYRRNVGSMGAAGALAQAKKDMEIIGEGHRKEQVLGPAQKLSKKVENIEEGFKANKNDIYTKNEYITNEDLDALELIAKTGSGSLPQIFELSTAYLTMPDKSNAAWAFAAAQLKAHRGIDLKVPEPITLDKLLPELRGNLTVKPNPAKTAQTIITLHPESEVKPEVKPKDTGDTKSESKEVKPEPTQEYLLNQVSSHRRKKTGILKLDGLTIGDLLNNQSGIMTNTNEDAGGLYQLSPDQLRAGYLELGLDINTKLTPDIQGKIFINRLQANLKQANSLAGLRPRFPALNTLKEEDIAKYTAIIQPTNPFNDMQSGCVYTGLCKAVAKN